MQFAQNGYATANESFDEIASHIVLKEKYQTKVDIVNPFIKQN